MGDFLVWHSVDSFTQAFEVNQVNWRLQHMGRRSCWLQQTTRTATTRPSSATNSVQQKTAMNGSKRTQHFPALRLQIGVTPVPIGDNERAKQYSCVHEIVVTITLQTRKVTLANSAVLCQTLLCLVETSQDLACKLVTVQHVNCHPENCALSNAFTEEGAQRIKLSFVLPQIFHQLLRHGLCKPQI